MACGSGKKWSCDQEGAGAERGREELGDIEGEDRDRTGQPRGKGGYFKSLYMGKACSLLTP